MISNSDNLDIEEIAKIKAIKDMKKEGIKCVEYLINEIPLKELKEINNIIYLH